MRGQLAGAPVRCRQYLTDGPLALKTMMTWKRDKHPLLGTRDDESLTASTPSRRARVIVREEGRRLEGPFTPFLLFCPAVLRGAQASAACSRAKG